MKRLNICAMIAAAGKSSRMGQDKALLLMDNEPLVLYSTQKLYYVGLRKIFVTLSPQLLLAKSLTRHLRVYGAQILLNTYMDLGYSGSIKTVIEECFACDGLLINPVDAPMFSSKLLVAMSNLARHYMPKPVIIVPYFFRSPGHPVYISKHFFKEFFHGEAITLRKVIEKNIHNVRMIMWPDVRILTNLNRPKDLNPTFRI